MQFENPTYNTTRSTMSSQEMRIWIAGGLLYGARDFVPNISPFLFRPRHEAASERCRGRPCTSSTETGRHHLWPRDYGPMLCDVCSIDCCIVRDADPSQVPWILVNAIGIAIGFYVTKSGIAMPENLRWTQLARRQRWKRAVKKPQSIDDLNDL